MSEEYAQMVDGCRRRDARAQRALYDAMAPMVFSVCMRFAGCRDEAQDMLQDVFVKVFERISSLGNGISLVKWVYKTTVNTCVDHVRRRRRWVEIDELAEDIPAVDTDPYTMEAVVEAMQHLTPTLRMVFNLCDVEGYKLDEVAEQLGSNNRAVRVALCRARSEIKRLLSNNL